MWSRNPDIVAVIHLGDEMEMGIPSGSIAMLAALDNRRCFIFKEPSRNVFAFPSMVDGGAQIRTRRGQAEDHCCLGHISQGELGKNRPLN